MYERTGYDQLPWFHPGPSDSVQRAVEGRFLAPGSSILDIGCGAGSNVLYLAHQGFVARGIDISPGAILAAETRARKDGSGAIFEVGDALRLSFEAASFDAATDIGCFHSLPIGRRRDYAREVGRVLRPGGHFVLSWVARESTAEYGPPHRPSLEEVTRALEADFLFLRTEFHPAEGRGGLSVYDAWMSRRTGPQPPPR